MRYVFKSETKRYYRYTPEEGAPIMGDLYIPKDTWEDMPRLPEEIEVEITVPVAA